MKADATSRSLLRETLLYVLALTLCLLMLVFALELWRADLRVPFSYDGDGLWNGEAIKGIIENGWYLTNPKVGLPYSSDVRGFPTSGDFLFFLLKCIGLLTHDYALTINLFFLLTFPLTTFSALFVFRQFHVSAPSAVVCALLFTFVPYHLLRGEVHLLLSAYFMIPWMVMVTLWVFRCEPLLVASDGATLRSRIRWKRVLAAVIICVLTASSGVYYAYFACFFLIIAGLAGCCRHRKPIYLGAAMSLAAVIVIAVTASMVPSFWFWRENGRQQGRIGAPAPGDEIYGMKIELLLLPVNHHRLPYLALKKQLYNAAAPLVNENAHAALGLAGSLGFLFLLGRFLFGRCSRESALDDLGVLNVSGLLLATFGSFGSLLMLTVLPPIRCYNRICVFIAFFSFFALAALGDMLVGRAKGKPPAMILSGGVLAATLILGFLDETPNPSVWWNYSAQQRAVENDREFFARVENALPSGAMVFQLPYVGFPESGCINQMTDYDHFRGYLNTRRLRWSYGAMKGSPGDLWQKGIAGLPPPQMLRCLARRGFAGLYINRGGYADGGAQVEREVAKILRVAPLVSQDGKMVVYPLSEFRERIGEPGQ